MRASHSGRDNIFEREEKVIIILRKKQERKVPGVSRWEFYRIAVNTDRSWGHNRARLQVESAGVGDFDNQSGDCHE